MGPASRDRAALRRLGLPPLSQAGLPSVWQWIERVVGWLGKVFLQDGPARPASPDAGQTLRRWRCHVQRFFYRTYASLRIEELFSIVRGGSPLLSPQRSEVGPCCTPLAVTGSLCSGQWTQ